ncbi:MAG: hypothetical protein LBD18_03245, partial [Treponema sp.]|nr:hypothetical protein [Treponema sp.]
GFAVILAAAIFSISLAGCPTDSDDGDDPNTLTITGINGVTGQLTAVISAGENNMTAWGGGAISSDTAKITLKKPVGTKMQDGGAWAGTGSFTIGLWKGEANSETPDVTAKNITIQKGNTDVEWSKFQ